MKHMSFDKRKYMHQGGFTLIELMVSVTIFAIVMTISVGTLLVMIDATRKAQSLQAAMTNISFVSDSITRNIRTGYNYYCASYIDTLPSGSDSQDCASGGQAISFVRNKDGKRVGFRLNTIDKSIERNVDNGGWLRVTSQNITINTFDIIVEYSGGYYSDGDLSQPHVSLLIEGIVDEGLESETDFALQTNVTQRVLDF